MSAFLDARHGDAQLNTVATPTAEMIATQVELDAAVHEDARDLAEALALLELCRRVHDSRRREMDRAATRLACSLEKLDAARRAAEEAGELVLDAMRLVSLRREEIGRAA